MRARLLLLILGVTFFGICPGICFAGNEMSKMEQRVAAVIKDFPLFGRSNTPIKTPLSMEYSYDKAGTIIALTFDKPAFITLHATWSIGPRSGTLADAEMKKHFESQNLTKQYVGAPEFGPYAAIKSSGAAGSDPNGTSSDPYFGSADAFIVTPCADVSVSFTFAVSPHASYGARDKPDVINITPATMFLTP